MIRVAAWALAAVCAGCLIFAPIGVGSLALAILFALFFIVATWPTQQPRSVSPYMSREHEKVDPLTWALGPDYSRLDRLDGLDTRTPNPERNTK